MIHRSARLAAPFLVLVASLLAPALAAGPVVKFKAPVAAGTAGGEVNVASADFDGDGKIDVASCLAGAKTWTLRYNAGSGTTFTSFTFAALAESPTSIAAGDIDGDGDADVVMATASGVVIARSDFPDSLPPAYTVLPALRPSTFATTVAVALADYDGDGRKDLIAAGDYDDGGANQDVGFVSWIRQLPGGGFGTPTVQVLGRPVIAMAAGDLTGDIYAEVVVAFESGLMTTVGNPGNGTFGNFAGSSFQFNVRSIVIADATNDGQPDFVVSGHGTWTPTNPFNRCVAAIVRPNLTMSPVLYQTFATVTYSFPEGADAGPQDAHCVVADVNEDGKTELVMSAPLEGFVGVYDYDAVPNGSGGQSFVFGDLTKFTTGDRPTALVTAPMDGDAHADVVVASETGAQLHVLVNDTFGGGGGDLLVAATDLHVSRAKNEFTFTATQSGANVTIDVLIQHSTTPDDAGSWTDLVAMARKRVTPTYKAVSKTVPAGTQYFRTVTRAFEQNDKPGLRSGAYVISAAGKADLTVTATLIPLGDPILKQQTFPGDTIGFVFIVRNDGTATAGNVSVKVKLPRQTTYVGATPLAGLTVDRYVGDPKTTKDDATDLTWEFDSLDEGEAKAFGCTVTVNADASGSLKFDSFSVKADSPSANHRVPSGAVKLPIGDALRLSVALRPANATVTTPTPVADVGGVLRWYLSATNLGAKAYADATVVDYIPRGTSFVEAMFVNAAGDKITPPAGPGNRANPFYDPAKRRVFWYLGSLAGATTVHLRLDTRVNYDILPGASIVNGQWQLRGTPPGATGDPLQFDALDAGSGNAMDVASVLSATAPSGIPSLRITQYAAVLGREVLVSDPGRGTIATVRAGGTVQHFVFAENEGGATAANCSVSLNLPNGAALVPDSVTADKRSDPTSFTPVYGLSSGGTLEVDLGNIPSGERIRLRYAVTAPAKAKFGTILETRNVAVRTDSLTGERFALPSELRVIVANPFTPKAEVSKESISTVGIGEGTIITYLATLINAGDVFGVNCRATVTVPEGTRLFETPQLLDDERTLIATQPLDANARSVKFDIPVVGLGAGVGYVRMAVQVLKRQKSGDFTCQATFTGRQSGQKGEGKLETGAGSDTTVFKAPTRASIVMAKFAPTGVVRDLEYAYTIVVGNKSGVDALDVEASMTAPPGTRATLAQQNEGGKVKGDTITWKLGTIPAYGSAIRTFQVIVDGTVSGCSIVEDTCVVTSSNADTACAGPVPSIVLEHDETFDSYRWPSLNCMLETRGMRLSEASLAKLSNQVLLQMPDDFTASTLNVDLVQLTNGVFVMPLGGPDANMVAAGAGNLVAAGAGNFANVSGNGLVAAGAGNLITIRNVAGFGDLTCSAIVSNIQGLVAAGSLNLVAAGGGNLIGLDGATLIGLDGSTLVGTIASFAKPSTMVAAGAGNILIFDGGNFTKPGASLIGLDGGTLIPRNGAWAVSLMGGNSLGIGVGAGFVNSK